MNKDNFVITLLKEIFTHIGEDPDIEVEENENVLSIDIRGNNLNYLIGYRGQALEALQNIISMALYRNLDKYKTVIVDINGYKEGKADRIRDMARKYIDKVRFSRNEVEMPRMNPWERRHIHVLISEYDDIESESTGEGKDRRVILKPKK
ncbi:KH domain-containing protein [Patescibacteria group bacterium]|nr:KH domain-containing protein [Patescibacteria group bacterium]